MERDKSIVDGVLELARKKFEEAANASPPKDTEPDPVDFDMLDLTYLKANLALFKTSEKLSTDTAKRIILACRFMGLTLQEVADLIPTSRKDKKSVTMGSVSRWLAGESINKTTRKNIAEHLIPLMENYIESKQAAMDQLDIFSEPGNPAPLP